MRLPSIHMHRHAGLRTVVNRRIVMHTEAYRFIARRYRPGRGSLCFGLIIAKLAKRLDVFGDQFVGSLGQRPLIHGSRHAEIMRIDVLAIVFDL